MRTTSAPISPSSIAASGKGPIASNSTIRMPASGPVAACGIAPYPSNKGSVPPSTTDTAMTPNAAPTVSGVSGPSGLNQTFAVATAPLMIEDRCVRGVLQRLGHILGGFGEAVRSRMFGGTVGIEPGQQVLHRRRIVGRQLERLLAVSNGGIELPK